MLSSTLQQFLLVFSYTSSPVQPASLPEQPAKQTEVLVAEQPTTNGAKKPTGDPLTMMPESQTDAGEKARLWLKQNNQMVTCDYIRVILMP